MAEYSNLESLKREWDVVFKSPATTRENSVRRFLRHIGMSGIQSYNYERLLLALVSPSGPIGRSSQQPSLLDRYKALQVEEREQFHKYVDETFEEVRTSWPEAFFEYQRLLNATDAIFMT